MTINIKTLGIKRDLKIKETFLKQLCSIEYSARLFSVAHIHISDFSRQLTSLFDVQGGLYPVHSQNSLHTVWGSMVVMKSFRRLRYPLSYNFLWL